MISPDDADFEAQEWITTFAESVLEDYINEDGEYSDEDFDAIKDRAWEIIAWMKDNMFGEMT